MTHRARPTSTWFAKVGVHGALTLAPLNIFGMNRPPQHAVPELTIADVAESTQMPKAMLQSLVESLPRRVELNITISGVLRFIKRNLWSACVRLTMVFLLLFCVWVWNVGPAQKSSTFISRASLRQRARLILSLTAARCSLSPTLFPYALMQSVGVGGVPVPQVLSLHLESATF